jgi:hypothetical protein
LQSDLIIDPRKGLATVEGFAMTIEGAMVSLSKVWWVSSSVNIPDASGTSPRTRPPAQFGLLKNNSAGRWRNILKMI